MLSVSALEHSLLLRRFFFGFQFLSVLDKNTLLDGTILEFVESIEFKAGIVKNLPNVKNRQMIQGKSLMEQRKF